MAADRLPEDVERDMTLVHADTCSCGPGIWPKDHCGEVRTIMHRAILAAMVEARADGIDESNNLNAYDVSGLSTRYRARAAAIREGK